MNYVFIGSSILLIVIPLVLGFRRERKRQGIIKYPPELGFWRKELRYGKHMLGGIIAWMFGSRLLLFPFIDLVWSPLHNTQPIVPWLDVPLMFIGFGLLMLSGWCLSWLIRK